MPTTKPLDRLIGIYRADGGLLGEARYVWAKVARGEHCELCDLTHRGVRRRADWNSMAKSLGVPFDLVHLNERSADLRAVSGDRTPCVVADAGGRLSPVLSPEALRVVGTDVAAFERALRAALAEAGLTLA